MAEKFTTANGFEVESPDDELEIEVFSDVDNVSFFFNKADVEKMLEMFDSPKVIEEDVRPKVSKFKFINKDDRKK